MTGKGIGSGSDPEMELRKGMPLPIVLRATLKLLAFDRDVNQDAYLNTAASTNAASIAGGALASYDSSEDAAG